MRFKKSLELRSNLNNKISILLHLTSVGAQYSRVLDIFALMLRDLQKYPNPPFFSNAEYLKSTLLSERNRNFSVHPTVRDLIQQLMHLTTHLSDCALNKTEQETRLYPSVGN